MSTYRFLHIGEPTSTSVASSNCLSVETVAFKPVNKYNSPQIKMRQDI